MPDFVTLTCPSCGAHLKVTEDIDRFACAHCGTEHIVRRSGGLVTILPIVEGLRKVQSGVDKTASELAIPRLHKEIAALQVERQKMMSRPNRYSWGAVLSTVPAFFLVFLLLLEIVGMDYLSLSMMGGMIAATISFAVFWWKQTKENQKRCLPIDRVIRQKLRELQEHHKIVSNVMPSQTAGKSQNSLVQ